MKKPWKIAVIADGVAMTVLFCLMWWFNSDKTHGVAALTALGGFAVSFALFQIALAVMIILLSVGWAAYIKARKK